MKNKASFLSIAAAVTLTLTGCVTINRASDEPSPQVTTVVVAPETSSPAPAEASSAEATQDTATSAPATQTQAPQPAAPEGVAPGTSCGPSNTGRTTLVVAETDNGVTCDQVQSIFADFNAAFAAGGSYHTIQGYSCFALDEQRITEEGRSVTCTQGETRLEAMTLYPLGGIPVENTSSYRNNTERFLLYTFTTDFAQCGMGGFEGYSIFCTGISDGQPVQVSVGQSFMPAPDLSSQAVDTSAQTLTQLPPSNSGKYLPKGEVFTTSDSVCLNSGDSVTCTYKGRSFTLSPTGYTLN
ncbi:hypothetical protein [Rothia nasimurium]|uniref:hypothetical protein n=1 Tax=Rothia nasimurium TaxID=85336 RepID=UPI001F2EC8C9|nr:hypothetical protein [Rothia nasimurium]